MAPIFLTPEPLRAETFAPFGDVIEISDSQLPLKINYGNTLRYHDLAKLVLSAEQGQPAVSLFRSTPLPAPVPIRVMERHPLSSQLFMPLNGRPYLVVVAPPGDFDAKKLRAFRAAPNQGVNYAPGTWHHFLLALDAVSDFLVVDRVGPGVNCDEVEVGVGRIFLQAR